VLFSSPLVGLIQRLLGENSAPGDASPLDQSSAVDDAWSLEERGVSRSERVRGEQAEHLKESDQMPPIDRLMAHSLSTLNGGA